MIEFPTIFHEAGMFLNWNWYTPFPPTLLNNTFNFLSWNNVAYDPFKSIEIGADSTAKFSRTQTRRKITLLFILTNKLLWKILGYWDLIPSAATNFSKVDHPFIMSLSHSIRIFNLLLLTKGSMKTSLQSHLVDI